MQPSSRVFEPSTFVRERHPDVQVIETDALPGRVQGGVDHRRRIIWLAKGLSVAARRSVLAYEIGQLQQGPTPVDPLLAAAHQRAAGDWAAQMLISTDELYGAFSLTDDYATMAAHLRVDVQTLRTRLRGMSDAEQDGVMACIRGLAAAALVGAVALLVRFGTAADQVAAIV